MFHSAALKLTTWYLAIIMILSIGCSIALYQVSSEELEQGAHRQIGYFNNLLGPNDINNLNRLRESQLIEDRDHLKGNLVAFNLGVLFLGGVASYGLARRTLRPIEDALESQTRFTSDASHELRTPLSAMQSEIEVALRDKKLSRPEAISLLKSNLEEAVKLRNLSDGLLRLAQENGRVQGTSNVSLKDIADEAATRVERRAKQRKIKLTINSSNQSVQAEHEGLVELLVILLDNAIKYSPKGSEVTLKSYTHNKLAHIQIIDQGVGISKGDLPHIFDRFYRSDNSRTKESAGGYGLGLPIAKKIVEAHHGAIEVKSAPNKGSTFTIKLPLRS